jgi:hypothetical protein
VTIERGESWILGAILLIVAGFAGLASFTHVHDWTMRNSPPGTPSWFGWANAMISELVPTACALVIRRRRRNGSSIGYPLALLVAAVALSLAAQLAVAKPGLSGWLLSAGPAIAFMALTKLVLSSAPSPAPIHADARPLDLDSPDESGLPAVVTARVNGAIPSGVIR